MPNSPAPKDHAPVERLASLLPEIHVHGKNVTAEAVREVGEQYAALLDTVSEGLGGPKIGLHVAGVRFACDGCGFRQPFDAPRVGWRHFDNDDFCPRCVDA